MRRARGWAVILALVLLSESGARADASGFGDQEPWQMLRPLVGEEQDHVIEPGETLHDVAYVHRLGFEAVRRLNRGLDPWLPGVGTRVRLPTRSVLPPAEPRGLVINLPEMRLYDFTSPEGVRVHAVAVGDRDDPTPIARFVIGQKRVDPFWRVPESIRRKRPHLPELVPPSEDNPLGSRWMTLGRTSYGIHGTNVRWSIGRSATHGCVRLYEDVMQALFDRVPEGTPVEILYAPYKWGTNGKDLFLEAHADMYGQLGDRFRSALETPKRLGLLSQIDIDLAWQVVEDAQGVPIVVGSLP